MSISTFSCLFSQILRASCLTDFSDNQLPNDMIKPDLIPLITRSSIRLVFTQTLQMFAIQFVEAASEGSLSIVQTSTNQPNIVKHS